MYFFKIQWFTYALSVPFSIAVPYQSISTTKQFELQDSALFDTHTLFYRAETTQNVGTCLENCQEDAVCSAVQYSFVSLSCNLYNYTVMYRAQLVDSDGDSILYTLVVDTLIARSNIMVE